MTRIQAIVFTLLLCEAVNAAEPIDIGSRLELMIDDHLVASTSGAWRICRIVRPMTGR